MKKLLLAGVMLAFAFPAYAADTLPDAMLGNWTMGDEEGVMDRADKDSGDFFVEKDTYYAVDTICAIKHVEKLGNSYIVQAICKYDSGDVDDKDAPFPPTPNTSEFEMKGDRLRVTPATGS